MILCLQPSRIIFYSRAVVGIGFAALFFGGLVGCGTVGGPAPVAERRDTSTGTAPASPTSASTSAGSSQVSNASGSPFKRGGGYYKDDGPGDNPPADLDAIPDAVPKSEPLHRFANNPYSVLGRDYTPLLAVGKYKARGMASWYGKRFHGQKTSTGEIYDMYAMTAAHPTLPLPSYARVTNLSNGKSVIVRVNDRGPFHTGRIIDLSWTAAAKLGYVNGGSSMVEVESLTPGEALPPVQLASNAATSLATNAATNTTTNASTNTDVPLLRPTDVTTIPEVDDVKGAWLQLGAFGNRDNAEAFKARLLRELDADMSAKVVIRSAGKLYRVQLGPWADTQDARGIADRLSAQLDVRPVLVRK